MGKIEGKNKRLNLLVKFGVFAISLFVTVTAAYLYSPVIKTHAVYTDDSTATLDINVGVLEELSLTVSSDTVEMSSNVNSFAHNPVNLTVKTNSQYGYTLSIEDADNDTKMNHVDSGITDNFTSNFTGAKTSSTMENNTWGWSPDGGSNYYFIPQYGNPALIDRNTNAAPGTVTRAIDFGAKVGIVTSGIYEDTVLFTAYVNGVDGWPNPGLHDKETGDHLIPPMQTFDCNTLNNGQTIRLRDIRDNNTYRVSKLEDGLCYMLDNLRLVNKTLTPEDSNVSSTFILKDSNASDFIVDENHPGGIDRNAVYYYDNVAYYSPYALYAGLNDALLNGTASSAEDGLYPIESSVCPAGWRLPNLALSYIQNQYNGDYSAVPLINNTGSYLEYFDYSQEEGYGEYMQEMVNTGMLTVISENFYKFTPREYMDAIFPLSLYSVNTDGVTHVDFLTYTLSKTGGRYMPLETSSFNEGTIAFPVTCITGRLPDQY